MHFNPPLLHYDPTPIVDPLLDQHEFWTGPGTLIVWSRSIPSDIDRVDGRTLDTALEQERAMTDRTIYLSQRRGAGLTATNATRKNLCAIDVGERMMIVRPDNSSIEPLRLRPGAARLRTSRTA